MRGDLRPRRGARDSWRVDALGHAARVDEDQRGAVRRDQLGQPVVDLLPDLARHHRFERRRRHLEGEVARAAVAGVDDRAGGARRAVGAGADQEARDRPRSASASPTGRCAAAGRRTARPAARATAPDARRACSAPARGSRRRSRVRVVASIVRPDSRAEQDVERLRRGDEDVRRPAAHALRARPAACRRCAPRCGSRRPAARARAAAARMPASGASQVALDVVRQRLERRDVDDLRLVRAARPSRPCRTSASIAARNAASVLPEPVGAAISTCRPAWIAGQASRLRRRSARRSCRSNQAATAGWNRDARDMRSRLAVLLWVYRANGIWACRGGNPMALIRRHPEELDALFVRRASKGGGPGRSSFEVRRVQC